MRNLLFVFAILAGCSGDSDMTGDDDGGDTGGGGGSGSGSGSGSGMDPADVERDYDDVAALLAANLAAGDLAAMVDGVEMSYGRMPAGFTVTQQSDYLLVAGQRGDLGIEYKLYCRDEADLFTQCNGLENHAHVKPTYTGTIGGAVAMDDVDRTASWTVRDLATSTPRIDGDGSNVFSSQLATGDYTLAVQDDLERVLFAATPRHPVGGRIDLRVNVIRNRPSAAPPMRTFDVTAAISFGAAATITLDGTHTYDLDLATGSVAD